MAENRGKKRSSTFGIIALVIAILAIFTPKILLIPVFGAAIVFMIIGFARDGSKTASTISLVVIGLVFFLMFRDASSEVETYTVTYEVECEKCSVNYINATGGTDKQDGVSGYFSTEISAQGKDFVHLTAQNETGSEGTITATIKVNGSVLETSTSSGSYSIASASGLPKTALY